MTEKKRGNYMSDCAKIKNERDALKELLKEVYLMAGMYYCDIQQIRYKIEQSGVVEK